MEPQAATSLPAGPQTTSGSPTALAARENPLPRKVVVGAVVVAALLPIILFLGIFALMVATNYNFLNWLE